MVIVKTIANLKTVSNVPEFLRHYIVIHYNVSAKSTKLYSPELIEISESFTIF